MRGPHCLLRPRIWLRLMVQAHRLSKLGIVHAGTGLLLALLVVAAGSFFLHKQRQAFMEAAQHELMVVADLQAGQIHNWRQERMRDALFFQKARFVSDRLQDLVANSASADTQAQLQEWFGLLQASNRYERILLYDAQGRLCLSSPATAEMVEPLATSDFAQALTNHQIVMSDFHQDPADGAPGDFHLEIFIPVVAHPDTRLADARTEPPRGVLVFRINAGQFLHALIGKWPTFSRTGETLLARRTGNEVRVWSPRRHQQQQNGWQQLSADSTNSPAVQATLTPVGPLMGTDYRGRQVLAMGEKVPETSWCVIAKEDQDEVDNLWQARSHLILTGLGLLLLTLGLGHRVVWQHQQVQLLRAEARHVRQQKLMADRFHAVFENVAVGMALVDQSGHVLEANTADCAFLGYSREELVGLHFSRFTHPDDLARDSQPYRALLAGELDHYVTEKRYVRKQGDVVWGRLSVSLYRNEQGEPQFTAIACEDITERKQAETTLRESEDKYRQLFESESDAIFLIENEQGRILEANQAATRLYGYGHEELLALKNTDLSAEPDETRLATKEVLLWCSSVFIERRTGLCFLWKLPEAILSGREIRSTLPRCGTLPSVCRWSSTCTKAKPATGP